MVLVRQRGGRHGCDPGAAARHSLTPLPLGGPTSGACDSGAAGTRRKATQHTTVGSGRVACDPGTADTHGQCTDHRACDPGAAGISGRYTRTIWWSIRGRHACDPGAAGDLTLILRPFAADNIITALS